MTVPLERQKNIADVKVRVREQLGLGSAAVAEQSDFATATQGEKADSAAQRNGLPYRYFEKVGDPSPSETREFLQSLINAGGAVYLPAADMFIDDELVLPQLPTKIMGMGQQATRIIQVGANKNGFTFAASGANTIPGNGTINKTVEISSLSILRGGTNGGKAISVKWLPSTNNQMFFSVDNVQIYNWNDGYQNWDSGIHLYDCNGSRITNCVIRGNVSETFVDAPDPYSGEAAIDYTGSGVYGLVNHFRANNTLSCFSSGVRISSWYEGIYSINEEIVQVYRGLYGIGDVTKKNPNTFMANTHFDYRYRGIDATNMFKIRLMQCDIFKAGYATATGYAGAAISLTNCEHFGVVGGTISTNDTILPAGILAGEGSYRGSIIGCNIQKATNGVRVDSANGLYVGGNTLYQCDYGVVASTAGNLIAPNHYESCTINESLVAGNKYVPLSTTT